MEVFFTASLREKEKYQDVYDLILETVNKEGGNIISLEVQDYSYLIPKKVIETIPKNELHYIWLNKGIKNAQCVIIEASRDSFRLGHEATLALLYNKPVLCLSDKKDYSDAIINTRFYAAQYSDPAEVKEEVSRFMKIVKAKHMSLRKNIYITSDHTNFLRWYGNKYNKNDSEVVRESIDKLRKENPEYETLSLEDLNIINTDNE